MAIRLLGLKYDEKTCNHYSTGSRKDDGKRFYILKYMRIRGNGESGKSGKREKGKGKKKEKRKKNGKSGKSGKRKKR